MRLAQPAEWAFNLDTTISLVVNILAGILMDPQNSGQGYPNHATCAFLWAPEDAPDEIYQENHWSHSV
jgi:hypothetical protein